MNEISCIYDMSEQRVRRFIGLREEWTEKERSGRCRQVVVERIDKIKADHEHLPQLLKDLKGSLDVVCREALMLCVNT